MSPQLQEMGGLRTAEWQAGVERLADPRAGGALRGFPGTRRSATRGLERVQEPDPEVLEIRDIASDHDEVMNPSRGRDQLALGEVLSRIRPAGIKYTMDFGRNLEELKNFLDTRQYRWALIGGVALAVYGLARTTLDLDLAVEMDAQEEIVSFMEKSGFQTLHRSAAYSNHLHPDPVRGRVDFLYVRGSTRDRLFAEAQVRKGPHGILVSVPKPEHLIAMKVLAIKSDPGRTFQDLADIRYLASLPGVDHDEIRSQFERHGLLDRYRELERTL